MDMTSSAVFLQHIDDALKSTAGAMLSQQQFDEVTQLRNEIRELCREGREEEARRVEALAMAIIRQGAPGRD